jgi:probable rRNA maturation factor
MGDARRLRVLVSDGRGRAVPARGLASWLERVAPRAARGVVSVALVSDARVRALNRDYRRKDYATDVLSFPSENSPARRTQWTRSRQAGEPRKPASSGHLRNQELTSASSVSTVVERFLGDIVIARGVARRQAAAAGHPESRELRVLALHGLLHLLGYDHERDDGRMRRVEQRLRLKGGLREGLIERAHRAPSPRRTGRLAT